MRESEERQGLLIESAKDFAIFTLTRDGIVDSWNSGAERVFGYKEDEILGKPVLFFSRRKTAKMGYPKMKCECFAARESRGRAIPSQERRVEIYASGIMTPLIAGGHHGFAKIARDLTEKKLAEEAIQRAQEQLEERSSNERLSLPRQMNLFALNK